MQITKYPQSCLVLCKQGQCIIIDPGNLLTAKYKLADLGLVEAVLYTHQHSDHFDPAILEQLAAGDIEIYANADTAAKIGDFKGLTVVQDKDELVVAGFKVTARDLPHCLMTDGSDGPPNTGYLVDGAFFHPGDGIELPGFSSSALALPIAGPTINFENALAFADSVKANKIIPIHYDVFKADPAEFAKHADDGRVIVLKDGESVEI